MHVLSDQQQETSLQPKPISSFSIKDLEVFLFRAPAEPPIQTSFGIMRDRPALIMRIADGDGHYGWGEVWCNFPTVGAEHRARLLLSCIKSLALQRTWTSPQECFTTLSSELTVLAIQSGEQGPLRQVLAGLDIAVWDMVARREGKPLWRLLRDDDRDDDDGAPAKPVPIYASGLNPTDPEKLAALKLEEGYRAFKLKVGFGAARDDANLSALREVIGADRPLMVDANQAWDPDTAREAGIRMARHRISWLEEPIRADSSPEQWAKLAQSQPIRLAGGENLAGLNQFEEFIAPVGMQVVQPDIGKWGGFSGCLAVARMTIARGKEFCPHWLGGGIGLLASLHLKTAVGAVGYVEVDANPNPLRELLAVPNFTIENGAVTLSERPGLGAEPDLDACRQFLVDVPLSGI
jgi:D-galactarolactone cycloisomerase